MNHIGNFYCRCRNMLCNGYYTREFSNKKGAFSVRGYSQQPGKLYLILLFACLFFNSCSYKKKITAIDFSLSPYFQSDMVFQKGNPLIIYGNCEPGAVLAVRIEKALKYASADNNGEWKIVFPSIDYDGNFNITVEGKEKIIELKDVSMGNVWIVIGDNWLPGRNIDFNEKVSTGLHNKDIRYFQPKISMNSKGELQGQWKFPDRKKIYKNEYFTQIAGEAIHDISGETTGIINLSWPGLNINDFTSQDFSGQDSLWAQYFRAQKEYQRLADSSFNGIEKGVLDRSYDDRGWMEIDFPLVTAKKWYIQDRIIWLRKKIFISSRYINSDFSIDFGLVYGHYNFYFNGVEIDKFKGESKKYKLIIPDTLVNTWTNLLTIRMVAGDSLTGLYSGTPMISNADSSYQMNIGEEWKFRTFLEPKLPDINMLSELKVPMYNILKHLQNIEARGIIAVGGYHFYKVDNTEIIGKVFKRVSGIFNSQENFAFLLSNPGCADSVLNYTQYNYVRNAQLLGAASSDFRIINIIDLPYTNEPEIFYNAVVQRFTQFQKK